MDRRILQKRLKGLLAFSLAFYLMFGAGIQVLAADYIDRATLSTGIELSEGIIELSGGELIVDNATINEFEYTITKKMKVVGYEESGGIWKLILSTVQEIPTTPIQPTSGGGGTHTHTLSWKIVIEPTEISDGRCEYSCECGHVEAAQHISFFGAITKRIIKEIQEAPENGTVTVENQFLRCLTDEIIDALHKRSDVSLEIIFKEEEKTYQCLIPAGKAPTDGGEWYGYFYLGSLYGWK